jgi:hypothetical protein
VRYDICQLVKIVDLEINMMGEISDVKVLLETVTLIVGQHDIGEF